MNRIVTTSATSDRRESGVGGTSWRITRGCSGSGHPDPLPAANDIDGLARFYKVAFNTARGAATIEQVKANYQRYVLAK